MKTPRPKFSKNDAIRICFHVKAIPTYEDKPHVGHDTTLYVSTISGRGTKRDPWCVVATDNRGHFWHFEPGDIFNVEAV